MGNWLFIRLVFISVEFCKLGLKKKNLITLLKDSNVSSLLCYLASEETNYWFYFKTVLLAQLLCILGFAVQTVWRLSGSVHCWVFKSNFSLVLLLSFDYVWFRFLLFVLSFVTCYMLDRSCMGFMLPLSCLFSAETTTCSSCIFVMKLSASSSLFCLARWVVSRLCVQSSAAMLFTVILH